MITRLILDNWRSHEHTEFDFAKGTNVLVGAMGSGKSSAMDAVSFALFGTFPSLQQRKVKLDDMIMNKPERKGFAKISLGFTADGKEYVITREVTKGKGQTSAELRQGDDLIDATNQRVSEKIADILKIDYDLFSRAVYAEQNNIDYFLEIPKGKRREKIDELLKIDKFETSRKNLGTVIGRLVDRMNDKNSLIENTQDTKELPALEKSIAVDSLELQRKEKELIEKRKEGESAEQKYEDILKKKKTFSEQDSRIKEDKGKIELLENKIKEYGEVKITEGQLKEQLTKKNEEKKQARSQLDYRRKKEGELEKFIALLDNYERTISQYDKKIQAGYDKNAPARLKECRQKHEEIRRTLQEMIVTSKSIEKRLLEIEESIGKLKGGVEKCPTCDATLDKEGIRRLLENRGGEKITLNHDKNVLGTGIKEYEELEMRLEKETEQLQKMVSDLEEMEWAKSEKEKLSKEASAARSNLEIIKNVIASIKIEKSEEEADGEIKKMEDTLDYFLYRKELENSRSEMEARKKEIEKLGYREEDEKSAYDKFKELDKGVAVVKQECKNLSDVMNERGKRVEGLKKIMEEAEKNRREIDYLGKNVDSLEILQKALQDVQGKLREEFAEETNLALTDIWKRLYPYNDYIGLKLSVDDVGDYILQLQRKDSGWINVEGTTSGGERSTACLALRIALALVLTQNLSWLVLDEPTHNLDRRAVKELSTTLREHLPKIVEQVFVITHEEELESAASGSLYRLDRNKQEDEPTKIVLETAI